MKAGLCGSHSLFALRDLIELLECVTGLVFLAKNRVQAAKRLPETGIIRSGLYARLKVWKRLLEFLFVALVRLHIPGLALVLRCLSLYFLVGFFLHFHAPVQV